MGTKKNDAAGSGRNFHVNAKLSILVWLEYIPFRMLCAVIQGMSLKTGYALNEALFSVLFLVDGRHRRRSIKHLLHAGVATNPTQARRMALKSFHSFSRLLVEIVKMKQLFDPAKFKMTGPPETLRRLCGDAGGKTNVINLTAHYGNWEAAGQAWAAHTGLPLVSVARPFSNPLIGDYIMTRRESDRHRNIAQSGAVKGMLRALREGKSVALLVDQHAGSAAGIPTMFFGHPCRSHASPALLHLKTGIPIVVHVTRRLDDDYHFAIVTSELICYQPTADKQHDIQAVTQMYTSALETLIREEPEQWLWAHRRWTDIHRKPHPPAEADDAVVAAPAA